MPPVQKVTVASNVTYDGQSNVWLQNIDAVLAAAGFTDEDERHGLAHACVHLFHIFPAGATVNISIEKTPAHLQATVDQVP